MFFVSPQTPRSSGQQTFLSAFGPRPCTTLPRLLGPPSHQGLRALPRLLAPRMDLGLGPRTYAEH